MKKYFLVLIIVGSILSCKKESNISEISFSTSFSRLKDSVSYDSVAFIVVKYSKISEFTDSSSLNDPGKYSYSVKYDVDKSQKINHHFITGPIRIEEGQYVIKKFDLIDKEGKVIYCVPYEIPENYKSNVNRTIITLPIIFSNSDTRTNFDFAIIKE